MQEAFVAKLEMITQYCFLNRLRKTEEIRYPVQVSKGVLLEDELKALHLAPLGGCIFCYSARQGHCNQLDTLPAPSPKSRDETRKHYQCMSLFSKHISITCGTHFLVTPN